MSKLHYIIPIFVPHEGCTHNCVFCNQKSITGNTNIVDKYFVRSIIESYLLTIKKKASKDAIIEVSFFGGTFTAIPLSKQNELLSVAKEYKEKGEINCIRLSTRPDYINKKILNNLKNYLVDIIELGVQSLDEEVLIKSGRGHTEKDVIYACNLIKKYNFILGVQVMIGLPGDNFIKDITTADKIINIKPDLCRIYPALTLKNTSMEKLYNKGLYNPYTLESAVFISKIIYGMFIANDINVIRIGLQPTKDINVGKEIVSGPFHPAFRELVEGSILNDIIIENTPNDYQGVLSIYINEKDISKLYCNKKIYFNNMKKQLNIKDINIFINNKLNRSEILLKFDNDYCKISMYDYFTDKYSCL